LLVVGAEDSEEFLVGFEIADAELEELLCVDAFTVAEEKKEWFWRLYWWIARSFVGASL
jgi:hypothetical protein